MVTRIRIPGVLLYKNGESGACPCPPLFDNARLLNGQIIIMCGDGDGRWNGDAETARVVSVTRLVSIHCPEQASYSNKIRLCTIASDGAGHLPCSASPSASN